MVILPITREFVWWEPGRQVGHRLASVNHAITSLNSALVFGRRNWDTRRYSAIFHWATPTLSVAAL